MSPRNSSSTRSRTSYGTSCLAAPRPARACSRAWPGSPATSRHLRHPPRNRISRNGRHTSSSWRGRAAGTSQAYDAGPLFRPCCSGSGITTPSGGRAAAAASSGAGRDEPLFLRVGYLDVQHDAGHGACWWGISKKRERGGGFIITLHMGDPFIFSLSNFCCFLLSWQYLRLTTTLYFFFLLFLFVPPCNSCRFWVLCSSYLLSCFFCLFFLVLEGYPKFIFQEKPLLPF